MPGLMDLFGKANPVAAGIGAAAKVGQSIFGIIQGAKMMKEAKKINPVYKAYETSPYAKAGLGMAQLGIGAKNPAQAAAERQMLGSQANVLASGQRAGLDPAAQAAMALASQGQMESGIENLSRQNLAFMQQNKADLYRAQEAMTGEERMKYQDMLTKYQMDTEQKNALRSAGQQSISGAIGNIAGTAFGLANLGGQTAGAQAGSTGGVGSGIGIADFIKSAGAARKITRPSPWG